jgi:hypothetical protein
MTYFELCVGITVAIFIRLGGVFPIANTKLNPKLEEICNATFCETRTFVYLPAQ